MKNIIILNGAAKKNGHTAGLIEAFSEGAKSAGNSVKEFYLQGMEINGCLDCGGCLRRGKTPRVSACSRMICSRSIRRLSKRM